MQEGLPLFGGRIALHLRTARAEHVQRATLVVRLKATNAEKPGLTGRRVVGGAARDLVDDDHLALEEAPDQETPRAAVVGHRIGKEVRLVQPERDDAVLRGSDQRLQLFLPLGPAAVIAEGLEGGRDQHVRGDALLREEPERVEGVVGAPGFRVGAHFRIQQVGVVRRRTPRCAFDGVDSRLRHRPRQRGHRLVVQRGPRGRLRARLAMQLRHATCPARRGRSARRWRRAVGASADCTLARRRPVHAQSPVSPEPFEP